jgi:hypothetical protein
MNSEPEFQTSAPTLDPAWIYGVPGEPNCAVVHAVDQTTAWRRAFEAWSGGSPRTDEDHALREDCECAFCSFRHGFMVVRAELFDGIAEPTSGDLLDAGISTHCARCDGPANLADHGHNIDGLAVCAECVTPEEWRAIRGKK